MSSASASTSSISSASARLYAQIHVQPITRKARQQQNIDRPAHTKTDKQCRTHTTSTARLPDD